MLHPMQESGWQAARWGCRGCQELAAWGRRKERRESMLASAGLLPLSCSPGKDRELLAGKCSLVSDTVLLSPEADTLREPLLLQ